MKVAILGGDGFCGWPASLYLSDRGHDVIIVDNLSRRAIDEELGAESLTPIASIEERLAAWTEVSGKTIGFRNLDVAQDYDGLLEFLNTERPDAVVLFIFVGIQDKVAAALESPLLGWGLVVIGLGLGLLAWRSKGEPNDMVQKLLGPLRTPSAKTVVVGYAMGVIQSLTSVPFFYGLMHLAAGDFSNTVKYGGLFFYATFALSLPTVCGLFIALVRAKPESWAGRAFAWARENSTTVALWSGYGVAAFLVVMGIFALL